MQMQVNKVNFANSDPRSNCKCDGARSLN